MENEIYFAHDVLAVPAEDLKAYFDKQRGLGRILIFLVVVFATFQIVFMHEMYSNFNALRGRFEAAMTELELKRREEERKEAGKENKRNEQAV